MSDDVTIQQRFEQFHADNPQVYSILERLARVWINKSGRKLGIRTLWERMRWEVVLHTHDANGDFKLNDHYTSRYVRLLIADHPEWEPFFELRRLRAS